MNAYRKRGRSGWSAGKKYKESANRSERQHEKAEIRQEVEQHTQGEDYKDKYKKPARKKNDQARAESLINWYKQALCKRSGFAHLRSGPWGSRLRSELEKLKKKYKEKYGEKDDATDR